MIDLKAITLTISEDDQQRFIQFLEKKNRRNDTKNIQLFKLLRNDKLDSKTICQTLYKDNNKVAYHALRKRLYQSLIDFTANISLEEENSIEMQAIKYILAARSCFVNNQPKVAYAILDKAEVLAQEHALYHILNEIYNTQIQYAYLNNDIDLQKLISKFKVNQKHHQLEDKMNMVYAKVRQTLSNMNYKGEVLDFQTILDDALNEHQISISDSLSFKSLYQLMAIVSISAFVTKDYLKIEPFLIKTYSKIKQKDINDKQLYYHIQIVYMIANALFRNKKFNASLQYLEIMLTLMQRQRKKYANTFTSKYHLLLALNNNFNGAINKAITCLENSITKKHHDIESALDIHLSLAMFYIQNSDFKNAAQLFSKFYHTDKYYTEKAGIEWVIKKNLIEIILHIELEHLDLVESRMTSFKRKYSNYLKQINQERVLTYLNLVSRYYKHPEKVTSKTFEDKVEGSFTWIDAKQEDIFVMSFFSWLKSKMESKPLYETTLNLIKKALQY